MPRSGFREQRNESRGFCHAAYLALGLALTILPGPSGRPQVITSQYDNARTGANLNETILTPQNVNVKHFGKLYTVPVDGDVYAQPLYLPKLGIPGKGTHNVVFVATEHDSVYALDAENPAAPPLWKVSFINPGKGVTPVPARDVRCPFIRPEVGITSTPVIDPDSGTLYVLARTVDATGILSNKSAQRLHALDVRTGAEKFGGPVEIKASVTGKKYWVMQGEIDFDPLLENPRSALLLVNGKVILTWASSCDVGPYHGWVMAYGAHTLAQVGVLNTSPDDEQSGIWQGDTGPCADSEGNVYVATGNGKFDASVPGGRDFGDSILELGLTGDRITVKDYFTPFDQERLNAHDKDLGSGGPLLLPDQPGKHPHLLIAAGKGGTLYVIDRDRMGHFHEGSDSNAWQSFHAAPDEVFGAPAFWNHTLYYLFSMDALKAFPIIDGRLRTEPAAQGNTQFIDPGATPTISANGDRNGIVWVIKSKGFMAADIPAVLHAYDASNVAHELYNSEQDSTRDRAGTALRFNIPTVADGRVFVGAVRELDVYGLLPAAQQKK
jgi:hypothetical protein